MDQEQKGFTDEQGRLLRQESPQTEAEIEALEQQAMEDQGAQLAWLQYLKGQDQTASQMSPEAAARHQSRLGVFGGRAKLDEKMSEAMKEKRKEKEDDAPPISVVERERSVEVEGPQEDEEEDMSDSLKLYGTRGKGGRGGPKGGR